MACGSAARKYDDDRKKIDRDLRASDEVRDGVLREVDRITEKVAALRVEIIHLRELVREKDARLDRVRSEEFWNRVMREVYELLPVSSGLTVQEILPRLRETIHREAAHHRQDVTAGISYKKMTTRVRHSRYFETLKDGAFGCKKVA